MIKYIFKISGKDWQTAHGGLFTKDGCENAGVFLCGTADLGTEIHLIVREFIPVPPELYQERNAFHLEISPQFYNSVVDWCLKGGWVPVIVHSHPAGGVAHYSPSDDFGEGKLLPVLQSLLPNKTVSSLVVTPQSALGRTWSGDDFLTFDEIRIVGIRSQTLNSKEQQQSPEAPDQVFDRQIRAFGQEGQRVIQSLKIGIVGVGGTGSAVAEQIARLGFRDITIIDQDKIEESNVSRVYGSTTKDVGKPKTDVIGKHLRELGAAVRAIPGNAIEQSVLLKLRDRHVIVSCVDNDRTRAILNKLAHQYLIPLIDIGVRLDARNGTVKAAAGRMSIVGPGMTCLRCSHHLNPDRIMAESMPKSRRKELAKEGYILGVDDPTPAVISLNTTLAGLAVTGLLNMFVDLTGGTQPVGQIYDAKTGTVFLTKDSHEENCDICSSTGVKAKGDSEIISAY
jgi:molybdopterin/thiamine biosynthesis adenylyltransferase